MKLTFQVLTETQICLGKWGKSVWVFKKKAKKQEVGTEKKSGFGSQNGDLQGEKRDAEPLLWI